MPNLNLYKKLLNNNKTIGDIHKSESDYIMEQTWYTDIGAKQAYIYDYYHDDEPLKYTNLSPDKSLTKSPIEIKYIVNAYNSENKDQVGYHIMFKPSYRWENDISLSYYKKQYIDKYGVEFPIGLYIDIPDEKGNYRKWLITESANHLGLQFPTWTILPIDHVFQWISSKGIKYQMCGVLRIQFSYNSGVWSDDIFTSVQNQRKCILPMNDISSTLFYNTRIILSAPIETPIVWDCTKVEQTTPKGVNRLTFAQSLWDEHKDVFEYEDGTITNIYYPNKIVKAMWASYNNSSITPIEQAEKEEENIQSINSKITYSGIKPEIKIGGNYKKFTINFYDSNNEPIKTIPGEWSFNIDGKDAKNILNILTSKDSNIEDNQIKVKFNGDNQYLNNILKIGYITRDKKVSTYIDVEITAL